jgi:hypothetical protein
MRFQPAHDSVHFGAKNKDGDTVRYQYASTDRRGCVAMTITIHDQPKKYILTDKPFGFDNDKQMNVHQIVQEDDDGIQGAIYKDAKTGEWKELDIRDPNDRTASAIAAADRNAEPDEGYEGDPHDAHVEVQSPTYLNLKLRP